jgi:hypothetical protein
MPRKTFRVAIAAEPISFDLEGPVKGVQNFHCLGRLAAGSLMRFAELFSAIEDESSGSEAKSGQAAQAIPAIRDFFDSALVPESRPRFWAMINDDDEGIPLETLVEIAGWLAEVYSGDRPTGPSSSDTSEGTSPSDASGGSQSPVATPTYSRSEPVSSST